MKKRTVFFLFLLLFITVSSAYSETLVLGTAAEYRPFIFYNYNNELTGLDAELIREIGEREGFTVRIMDMAFTGLVDSVSIGQIDLIGGGFAKTAEREKSLLFSNVYYTNSSIIIATAHSSIPENLKVEQMTEYRFGVQRGSSFDQWLKTNLVSAGLMNTQNIFTFATLDSAVKALLNGSVDLLMLDSDSYEKIYKKDRNFKVINESVGDEDYAFAAAKDSENIISRINDGLRRMRDDGSLNQLLQKYIIGAGEDADVTITRPTIIERSPSAVPTPTPVPPIGQPANCKNVMVYMADVTYPDGTEVNPGTKFTKTWRIYNNGSCKWYEGYSIVFTDGDYMSANSVSIPSLTIPGTTVDVPMDMVAPQADGQYVGYYQLRAPDGTFFGPKLTAKITVTERQVSAPPAGAPPVITRWQPNYYKGDNGFCPTVYWTVNDANWVGLSINNKRVYTTDITSGSLVLCPGGGAGDYVYGIVAEGTKRVSYVFTYTNTGGGKAQPKINATAIPQR